MSFKVTGVWESWCFCNGLTFTGDTNWCITPNQPVWLPQGKYGRWLLSESVTEPSYISIFFYVEQKLVAAVCFFFCSVCLVLSFRRSVLRPCKTRAGLVSCCSCVQRGRVPCCRYGWIVFHGKLSSLAESEFSLAWSGINTVGLLGSIVRREQGRNAAISRWVNKILEFRNWVGFCWDRKLL